jgi:hypothetical protein
MSTDTLQLLSGDLAFAVGYSIAQELIELAQEAQIGTEELVVCVLAVTLLLNSTSQIGGLVGNAFSAALQFLSPVLGTALGLLRSTSRTNLSFKIMAPNKRESTPSNSKLLLFGRQFLSLAKRLSQSIALQLLSSTARADSSSRAVRIVSLLSVTVFFVFVQTTSNFNKKT